jgi:hypothetical protein
MYRSDDAGAHWAKLNDFVVQDPEYYGEIFADPFKEGRVYLMDMAVRVSEDYGRPSLRRAGKSTPTTTRSSSTSPTPIHLLEGNDGGLYETYDHGRTWRHFNNIPVTQFYRVSVDNALPFYQHLWRHAGQRQPGSALAHAQSRRHTHQRLDEYGGGDGFQSRADYADPNTVYSCSQNIACNRLDLKSGASVSIRPRFGDEDAKLRSRWDIPFIISPHSHTRLYIAANRLMRSDDRGGTWKLISPDLTRNLDRDTIP